MFTGLLVIRRGRALVGGLSHRDLPVERLQVDEHLGERRVDALQLRLQGVDRRLGLGGRVRGGVALIVGTRGQGLAHRRKRGDREGQRTGAQCATTGTMR